MSDPNNLLLRHNLKTLRLPTMLAEYAKLSREAADGNEDYEWKGARKTPTRGWGEGRGKCPHWIAGLSVGLPMAARSRQTGDAYSDGLS